MGFDGPYFDYVWQTMAISETLDAWPAALACGGKPAPSDEEPRSATWRFGLKSGLDKPELEVGMGEIASWTLDVEGEDHPSRCANCARTAPRRLTATGRSG
jgi:hypothetical protein